MLISIQERSVPPNAAGRTGETAGLAVGAVGPEEAHPHRARAAAHARRIRGFAFTAAVSGSGTTDVNAFY
jgi:hypothetical protein